MVNNGKIFYLHRCNRQGVMADLVLLGLDTAALPGLAGVDMQEVSILT